MESFWKLFCVATVFFAGGLVLQSAHADCEITIIGNDKLISGVQQDITCIANCGGGAVITSMQWLLDFSGIQVPFASDNTGADQLVLSLTPTLEVDGNVFICRVTTDVGTCEENITICVKELEHELDIVPSQNNPVLAGSSLTLTCVALASRLPHLSWLDEDGNTIITGQDITVSQLEETVNATITMMTITFSPLKTSHAGLYTCNCEIIIPSSSASTSYIVEVEIPPPTVTVTRDPPAPLLLYTGDSLVLTCAVEVSVYVDTAVDVMKWWHKIGSGPVHHNPPRVTVSSAQLSSSVNINDIISSDAGTYECSVQLSTAGILHVNDSIKVTESVEIPASLEVEITIKYEPPCDYTNPSPPYYRPCTNICLSCNAYGTTGALTYEWTSSNAASFVHGRTDQTVTAEMLTYKDGGVHTCCVHDGAGNSGCSKTQMVMKGNGMYVEVSEYINGMGIPDNDIVVPQTSTCVIDIYCCADTTSNTMSIEFPNGDIKEMADDYYNIYVEPLASTARIRAYSVESFYPQQLGLYCCNIGDDVVTSVAMYSALPGPPRVYNGEFSCNEDTDQDYVINITCSTSDSPPTKVEWCRNGEPIDIDGIDYDAVQIATDRKNMYFDNILYVKNPCFAAGIHTFECKINNSQGSDSHTIHTNVPVYVEDATEIVAEGSNFDGDMHTLTCIVTLPEKLMDLLPFIEMEWIGPPGVDLTEQNNIFISEPSISDFSVLMTMSFNPLKTNHAGLYRCNVGISKPALAPFFVREIRHEVIVITQSLFQIHFGRVPNCMEWDSDLACIMEENIKRDMVDAINERCHCGFTEDLIDMGEMSCHYSISTAVYRARLTAMIYTATDLLAMVEDWIWDDGTFMFLHNYPMRLRMNPKCPLIIKSYSEPECGLSVEDINKKIFL